MVPSQRHQDVAVAKVRKYAVLFLVVGEVDPVDVVARRSRRLGHEFEPTGSVPVDRHQAHDGPHRLRIPLAWNGLPAHQFGIAVDGAHDPVVVGPFATAEKPVGRVHTQDHPALVGAEIRDEECTGILDGADHEDGIAIGRDANTVDIGKSAVRDGRQRPGSDARDADGKVGRAGRRVLRRNGPEPEQGGHLLRQHSATYRRPTGQAYQGHLSIGGVRGAAENCQKVTFNSASYIAIRHPARYAGVPARRPVIRPVALSRSQLRPTPATGRPARPRSPPARGSCTSPRGWSASGTTCSAPAPASAVRRAPPSRSRSTS